MAPVCTCVRYEYKLFSAFPPNTPVFPHMKYAYSLTKSARK